MNLAEALHDGLTRMQLALSAEQEASLLAYQALLAKWNAVYNLTAVREPERMLSHHLLDSLAVLPHLPATDALRLLDIGSGGGLPAVPLAIARPGWTVVSLDSNSKKTAFVQQAGIELRLPELAIATARVENYQAEAPFDVVISRAFSDLADFVRAGAPQLAPDGKLYAMKGVHPYEEIAQLPAGFAVEQVIPLHVPLLDAERHLIIIVPTARP